MHQTTDSTYLIIAGAPKAGTTALFYYLAEHPEVCGSNLKETMFFLDRDFPRRYWSKYHFNDGMETYNAYFDHCDNEKKLRIEATPDYMYSPGTPERIKSGLEHVKLIFALRHPIDRLKSVYRFSKQNHWIAASMSFEEYAKLQLEMGDQLITEVDGFDIINDGTRGRYSQYLPAFYEIFSQEQIMLLSYDELKNDPGKVLHDICEFANIDASFYQNYDFTVLHNRTYTVQNTALHGFYNNMSLRLRNQLHDVGWLNKLLRVINKRMIVPIYLLLNTTEDEKVVISDSLRQELEDFYREDIQLINELNQSALIEDVS